MTNNENRISFIGCGNMARSIIGGLISAGWRPENITAADPDAKQRALLAERFNVICVESNAAAIVTADVVVLAVKPQLLESVLRPLAPGLVQSSPLLVSIAAGVRVAEIKRWSGIEWVVRVMPNTPALVSSGASGLFAATVVSANQKQLAESIIRAVGAIFWVEDEALIDTITAVSGSGPAYFFLMMEVIEKTATESGLDSETARLLVIETALGAARLALASNTSESDLRKQVTSPGGTTEAAINAMQALGFSASVEGGVRAALQRSRELGDMLACAND